MCPFHVHWVQDILAHAFETRLTVSLSINEHVSAEENPHVTHYPHEFKIKVSTGIMDSLIIVPVLLHSLC